MCSDSVLNEHKQHMEIYQCNLYYNISYTSLGLIPIGIFILNPMAVFTEVKDFLLECNFLNYSSL